MSAPPNRHPSRDEIADIQLRKLKVLVGEILTGRNAFYQAKFAQAGITSADSLSSLSDLTRLPFTTKEELSADQITNPRYGSNLTYPRDQYLRIHQSSGTKGGTPLRWLDTTESWQWIMECWRIIYEMAEVRADDRFFFPFSFGPFLGFWAGFEAAVRFGYFTAAGGGMTTQRRLQFILENDISIIGCTPTYALHMLDVAREQDINLAASSVRMLIVAGEPGGSIPETKRRIEEGWGARCFDHSGMTEVGSLGMECAENPGGVHILETECIAEIINPSTLAPVASGERGELVLTNLGRLGSPLIRYRTGDIVQADTEPCPCGRSLLRLKGGILARADDMVTIRGNNVYPGAVEAVLRSLPWIVEYRADVRHHEGLAVLILTVEPASENLGESATLTEQITQRVKDALNFRPEVQLVPAGTLPRFEMKASRFVIHPVGQKT